MDLLGNYSSSDDDDDSSASERSKSPPTPIVKKSLLQQGPLPPAMPSPKKPGPMKGNAKAARTNKRGKKLISLHSVLPPHILEQLTKSETTGSFGDSSDEEEDENKHKKSTKKSDTKAASNDEGIANFLSALGSAKTNGMLQKSTTKTEGVQATGKLGAAFIAVSSTTTTRTNKNGIQSTTVVDGKRTQTPTQQGEAGSPSHYKPLSLSPRTAFRPFRTSGVSAAPPVPIQTTTTSTAQMPTQSNSERAHAGAPSAEVADQTSGSAKIKKRQLQKALRTGNLDEVLAVGGNITNLEQARPTDYVPKPETYAVPKHGVRVAATQMYNPKVGADVQADLGSVRAKGKNQINQLMASAANFELQQARSGQKTNNQRAGAKRKYGW